MSELQQVLSKLGEMSGRQEERHLQNKKDVNVLFKKMDEVNSKISDLPCDVHNERISNNVKDIGWLKKWMIIFIASGGMIGAVGSLAILYNKVNGG